MPVTQSSWYMPPASPGSSFFMPNLEFYLGVPSVVTLSPINGDNTFSLANLPAGFSTQVVSGSVYGTVTSGSPTISLGIGVGVTAPLNLAVGSFVYDSQGFIPNNAQVIAVGTTTVTMSVNATGTSSTTDNITYVTQQLTWSGVGATGTNSGAILTGSVTAQGDYNNRIAAQGTVFHHPFQASDEVDAFVWSNGFNQGPPNDVPGNDPYKVAVAPDYNSSLVNLNTSDGPATGFYCLEIIRAAGSAETSHWYRPMSPIVGGTKINGNGRGAGNDDPGAGGTITPLAWQPTVNGVASWGPHGWYGNIAYVNNTPLGFDGQEYWMQARVKIDPNRAEGTLNLGILGGKLFYFTRADRTLTDQECVTESYDGNGSTPNVDYFAMYRSGGAATVYSGRTWQWPLGQWATVLFHVKPGTNTNTFTPSNGNESAGAANTLIECWGAYPGDKHYTLIFSLPNVALPFDVQSGGTVFGHQAIVSSTYQNGSNMTQFYHRIGQMIFSQHFIPLAQV